MTNLEMITSSGALNYPIDESVYSSALIRNGLTPTDTYESGDEEALDLAISDLALTLIFSAKKISDDGYSVELQDVPSLWSIRRFYRGKWGYPDDEPIAEQPTIYDLTRAW